MDSLMKRINRDGADVARRFLIEREEKKRLPTLSGNQTDYLRGSLAGLSRAASYITEESIDEVEARWLSEASVHFTVPQ